VRRPLREQACGGAFGGAHRDYAALLRSRRVELGEGLAVRVLDLKALIETKKEAGREKDLAALPILRKR